MANRRKAVDSQIALNRAEIKIEQIFKHPEISLCKMVDAAVVGPHPILIFFEIPGKREQPQIFSFQIPVSRWVKIPVNIRGKIYL